MYSSSSSSSSGSGSGSPFSKAATTSILVSAVKAKLGGGKHASAGYQLKGPESTGKDSTGEFYKQTSSCGSFARHRNWELSWSDTSLVKTTVNGSIIQVVTRKFNVEQCTDAENDVWAHMDEGAIDTYVSAHSRAYATIDVYWEAWEVKDGAALYADLFGLCPIVPDANGDPTFTTRGTFVMTGKAAYYPDIDDAELKKLGFSVLADHPSNGLLATNSDPGLGAYAAFDAPDYTVTVTWNSNTSMKKSCISKIESSGG